MHADEWALKWSGKQCQSRAWNDEMERGRNGSQITTNTCQTQYENTIESGSRPGDGSAFVRHCNGSDFQKAEAASWKEIWMGRVE